MQYNPTEQVNVCVGKEWYRFPSNYFLPHTNYVDLQFVESGFTGLLPKPFKQSIDATWVIPEGFNDQNKQEMDRYVKASKCHYMVDLDFAEQLEPHYANDTENWEIIESWNFLDSGKSHSFFKLFWIPHFSSKENVFNHYYLLKNKKLKIK